MNVLVVRQHCPKVVPYDLYLVLERTVDDVAYHGTCEYQLHNPKAAEVCFSVSHTGCNSPSSAKFDPELNRLLQCRLCRLATTQHHSAPGGYQRCCSSGTASQKVRPHPNPDAR